MPRKSSPKKRSAKSRGQRSDSTQRLQRLLASAGFGSRRQCEELIEAGRVELDGEIVTKLGTKVDPSVSKVRVDGVLLKKQKLVYYAVNKPVGYVTTNRDPQGRPRVVDLVPRDERVFPVGRLDRNSEGLILLTNDGELAQKLTHPKFGVRKVYRVTVAGKVETETMRQMRKGIYIAEGFVSVEGAKLLKSRSRSTEMEIVLREGKNREIRRILARLGHKVQHLRRIAVGPLRLGEVPPGAYRSVSNQEVEKLWRATELASEADTEKRGSKKRGGTKRGTKKWAGTQRTDPSTRRPTKKSAAKKSAAKKRGDRTSEASIAIELGESRRTGAIIGADSESKPDKPKRSSKVVRGKRKTASGESRGSKRKTAGPAPRGGKGTSRSTKKSGPGKTSRSNKKARAGKKARPSKTGPSTKKATRRGGPKKGSKRPAAGKRSNSTSRKRGR